MSWKTLSQNRLAPSRLIPSRLALPAALMLVGPAAAQDIQVESLGPVDPFSIGVLAQSQGGLPESLWNGTTGALAREAIARAPANSGSPAVNTLIAKALLSGGEPPEGGDGAVLAMQRMEALIAAGFAAEAATLSSRTPDISERGDLAEAQARGHLLSGDLPAACRTAEILREGRDAEFWLRLRAVCLASEGETARADLTAQLARQAGRNEQFERAYALALLGEAPDENVETADPLVFATAVQVGAIIAPPANAPRAMLVTPLPGAAPEDAALYQTDAARIGLATPQEAAAAYEAVESPDVDDELGWLDAALDAGPGVREAWLYQLALEPAAAPEVRAQAIAASLESADGPAAFILAARTLAPALRLLPPDAGRNDALLFAVASAGAGDAPLARRWRDLATQPPTVPVAQDSGAPVPLGVRPPWESPEPADLAAADALIALWGESPEAGASRLDDEGDPRIRFIDAIVLDALGKSAEPELRLRLLRGEGGEGERADANVLLAMEVAAESGALAETALLAAAAMGQGPATIAPADLSRVVRALDEAGLGEDARNAGLEAMIAARQ